MRTLRTLVVFASFGCALFAPPAGSDTMPVSEFPARVISFGDSLSDLGTYVERTGGKT